MIYDCYNANPVSMKASIDVLAHTSGRRIAVLGDMGELGAEEKELHRSIGKAVPLPGLMHCSVRVHLRRNMPARQKANPECEVHYKKTREEMTEELLAYVKKKEIPYWLRLLILWNFQKVVEALTKE